MLKTLWAKAIGTVLAFFIIGGITGTWYHLTSFWEVQASVLVLKEKGEQSQKNQEQIINLIKELTTQVDQVMVQQEQMKELILTPDVTGRITVGSFGRDAAYVEINEHGKASMYLTANNISLTYRDKDGISHTVTLPVRGSFLNQSDNGHLVMLSAKTGRDLGIDGIKTQVTVGAVRK